MALLYMKGLSTIRIQAFKITCCFRKTFKLELLATMEALNGLAMWIRKAKATFSRVFVIGSHCILLFIFIGITPDCADSIFYSNEYNYEGTA